MSRRTLSYDCYDYTKFRQNINDCLNLGAILVKHLTWFTEGSEMDLIVIDQLKKGKCIVILKDDEGTGKLVGVVATDSKKNTSGCNIGRVTEVIYDRDDRTFKKRLNKVKSFFSGIKSKGYVDNFTQYRDIYNTVR